VHHEIWSARPPQSELPKDPIRIPDSQSDGAPITNLHSKRHSSPSKRRKPMRLRRNQTCPIHRSRFCCGRETVRKQRMTRQLGVRRIEDEHHPRVIGNCAQTRKCASCWTKRSWPKTASAVSARRSSPITATSCPTTSILAAWTEHGETITLTTSKRFTGGAMEKRDRHVPETWVKSMARSSWSKTPLHRQFLSNERSSKNDFRESPSAETIRPSIRAPISFLPFSNSDRCSRVICA